MTIWLADRRSYRWGTTRAGYRNTRGHGAESDGKAPEIVSLLVHRRWGPVSRSKGRVGGVSATGTIAGREGPVATVPGEAPVRRSRAPSSGQTATTPATWSVRGPMAGALAIRVPQPSHLVLDPWPFLRCQPTPRPGLRSVEQSRAQGLCVTRHVRDSCPSYLGSCSLVRCLPSHASLSRCVAYSRP
jgi:hypothetical protein